jgi:pimeloyl-ACP methyl ester carboxylesterase
MTTWHLPERGVGKVEPGAVNVGKSTCGAPGSETHYARTVDGLDIAYQVHGDGPRDLLVVPGIISHVEFNQKHRGYQHFLDRLASFARVIIFDKRGNGLSDRVPGAATLEDRLDDARAVLDAAGSTTAAVLGMSEGGPMSVLFAGTYPARTSALILYGSYARFMQAPDYPFGVPAGPSVPVRPRWTPGARNDPGTFIERPASWQ